MRKSYISYLVLTILICTLNAHGQSRVKPSLQIHGRTEILVNSQNVRLSDIAEIVSERIQEAEAAIALGKIIIAKSPMPNKTITLSASEVLSVLQEKGVDFHQVGYAFPRVMSVKRVARAITPEEITKALGQYFASLKESEISIKQLHYEEPVYVSPSPIRLEVRSIRPESRGKIRAAMYAETEGSQGISFNLSAEIDEYAEIPVAARAVIRGSTIHSGDITFARMNLSTLPSDALRGEEDIIGHEVRGSLGYGDVFRRRALQIPPIIKAGDPVSIQFSSKHLVATATGSAIDSGAESELIRVRNEASKKVLQARVIATGLVEVNE